MRCLSNHSDCDDDRLLTRRNLLELTAVGSLAALGGCLGAGTPPDTFELDTRTNGRTRRIETTVDGRRTLFTASVPASEYTAAKRRDRSFRDAVHQARSSSVIDALGQQIGDRFSTSADRFVAAQGIVDSLQYLHDDTTSPSTEYVRYPVETLVEGVGDCEDLAILLLGLLSSAPLGCRTGLLVPKGHVAVLVALADVPESLLVPDPLTVTVAGVEYVYVESSARHPPGSWANDHGERPLLAAYRGCWYPLDTEAVVEELGDAIAERRLGEATQYFR